MVKVLAYDGGHSSVKYKTSSSEGSFPSDFVAITDAEFNEIERRYNGDLPQDFVQVNGVGYVVGDTAANYRVAEQEKRAARYTKQVAGVLLAATLGRAYNSGGEVEVVASHPPGDQIYREHLMGSLVGEWSVRARNTLLVFDVIEVSAYDEPQGGISNLILSADGTHLADPEIAELSTLVLDVGGGTCSLIGTDPGGWVNYGFRPITIEHGIGSVIDQFEHAVRDRYADDFIGSGQIPAAMWREALMTGVFRGDADLDCSEQAAHSKNFLVNEIATAFRGKAGGRQRWQAVALTGGGPAMLHQDLVTGLGHKRIVLTDEYHSIHMSNVRGLRKLRNYYKVTGNG